MLLSPAPAVAAVRAAAVVVVVAAAPARCNRHRHGPHRRASSGSRLETAHKLTARRNIDSSMRSTALLLVRLVGDLGIAPALLGVEAVVTDRGAADRYRPGRFM